MASARVGPSPEGLAVTAAAAAAVVDGAVCRGGQPRGPTCMAGGRGLPAPSAPCHWRGSGIGIARAPAPAAPVRLSTRNSRQRRRPRRRLPPQPPRVTCGTQPPQRRCLPRHRDGGGGQHHRRARARLGRPVDRRRGYPTLAQRCIMGVGDVGVVLEGRFRNRPEIGISWTGRGQNQS